MPGADSAAGILIAGETLGSMAPADRRFRVAIAVVALLGFAAGDALRPVDDQISAKAGVAVIDAYRATAGFLLSKTGIVRCRFEPSCSAYGR